MFSTSSRGNYAPLNDEGKGTHTHMVTRWMPEGRTIFRIILGCTFALGIIALLKTTGTTENVQKYFPHGYQCDQSPHYDCAQCHSAAEDAKGVSEQGWKFDWQRDGGKYGLSENQCDIAFPGLWKDIELALEHRSGANVTIQELDDSMEGEGAIRCMIWDGQVWTHTALQRMNEPC